MKSYSINLIISIILFFYSVFFIYNFLYLGIILDNKWPFNSVFEPPESFGNDFSRVLSYLEIYGLTYYLEGIIPNEETFAHGPLSLIFHIPFLLIKSILGWKFSYLVFCLIFTFSLFYSINLLLKKNLVSNKSFYFLSLISFPVIYLFERGNIEGFTFIFFLLGLIFYYEKQSNKSIFFFIIATLIKPYTGIIFILFLKEKKYKEFLISAIIGLVVSLIVFYLYDNSITLEIKKYFLNSQNWFEHCFKSRNYCFELSLVFPFKYLISLDQLHYKIFQISLLFFVIFIILFHKVNFWQIITLFNLMIFYIPPISHSYKLIFILSSVVFFIANLKNENKIYVIYYSIIFACLLSPFRLFYIESFSHMVSTYMFYGVCNFLLFSSIILEIIYKNYFKNY